MKALVIDGGGRGHALVWGLKKSRLFDQVICAPGNGGISELAQCYPIKADDIYGLLGLAQEVEPALTVIGPEAPLVLNLAGLLRKNGFLAVGPDGAAAQLEGSKVFCKEFCRKNNIPTADFQIAETASGAIKIINEWGVPIMIKADGLCGGKGAIPCYDLKSAYQTIRAMMIDEKFGKAGNRVVIERFLTGKECSLMYLIDRQGNIFPLLPARDYKRLYEGGQGPNTGGMGSFAPATDVDQSIQDVVMETIVRRTIAGLHAMGIDFQGVLYAGLMVTDQGIMLLEFNVRFGDPETQAVLPLYNGDVGELLMAAAQGRLDEVKPRWLNKTALCTVVAGQGYATEGTATGQKITGLDLLKSKKNVIVFHAGTKMKGDNLVVSGGRVVGVTVLMENVNRAQQFANICANTVQFDGATFRRDIGS